MIVTVFLTLSLSFSAVGTSLAAKKPVSLTSAVIENIDMEYAEQIIRDLETTGSASTIDGKNFGFRGAGSSSAHLASLYVKDKMENRTGLVDVTLDKIPLDAWEFRGAWLNVPSLGLIQAASYGGSPGTNGVIEAEIVDVGDGFHSGYEGKDVNGKIVLGNWIGSDYWVDSMAAEAYLHGAAAIVVTTYDSEYGKVPGAIECHDGLYRTEWPPMLSISGDDGLRIINVLGQDDSPLIIEACSDISILSREEGGFGWNVVGMIPGKWYNTDKDEYVLLGDHTDAWFLGGMDDNSGIAATLVLADAFKKTYDKLGMAPDRTLIFVIHEAEEYGILNTYYDWCYGAWYEITKVHPEWVGRSVGYLNFECMGMAGLPLDINMSPELVSFVHEVLGQNKAKLPYGFKVTPAPYTWADHWTYAAAGIPAMEIETLTDEWYEKYYHNQYDTIDLIDMTYLQNLFEVFADMTVRLTVLPIIPYNFETSADRVLDRLMRDDEFGVSTLYPIYEKYGIDPMPNMARTVKAAEDFKENAVVLKDMLKYANPTDASRINEKLMSIAAVLGQSLVAMGVWEQDWYPYQQSANDVLHMDAGIEMLKSFGMGYDVNDALWELNWVGIMWYYDYMCEANYYDQMSRLTGIPNGKSEVDSWGLQTHLLPAVDLWDEYDYLNQVAYDDEPDLSWVIDSLEGKMIDQALSELEMSFETMWTGLENANSQMRMLIEDS